MKWYDTMLSRKTRTNIAMPRTKEHAFQDQRQKVLQDEIQKAMGKLRAMNEKLERVPCGQRREDPVRGPKQEKIENRWTCSDQNRRRRRREDPVLGPKQETLENRWTCSDQMKCAQMHQSARRVAKTRSAHVIRRSNAKRMLRVIFGTLQSAQTTTQQVDACGVTSAHFVSQGKPDKTRMAEGRSP